LADGTGLTIIMMGATGAVGSSTVAALLEMRDLSKLTLLGRRTVGLTDKRVLEHVIDVAEPDTYRAHILGHDVAICTLGVGQPTKVSREALKRIDHDTVLIFAKACRQAGVRHFELLGSVGASSSSRSFFLRTKGELEDSLEALGFDSLSIFQPSMIITPNNRYGLSQALTLAVWPKLNPILFGPMRKFRGVAVAILGRAIALRAKSTELGVRRLHWDDFQTALKGAPHQ
jgi:uncharacterized protein YbjT (DUF2867 family)